MLQLNTGRKSPQVYYLLIFDHLSFVFSLYLHSRASSISVSAQSFQWQTGGQLLFAFKLAFGPVAPDNKLKNWRKGGWFKRQDSQLFIWGIFLSWSWIWAELGLFNFIIFLMLMFLFWKFIYVNHYYCFNRSDSFENPVLQQHFRNLEALALDLTEPEQAVDVTCKKAVPELRSSCHGSRSYWSHFGQSCACIS